MIYDLRISDEIPPYSSTESYNVLCFSIYIHGFKHWNFGKNYYDYEGISGYSLIDKELLSTLAYQNNLYEAMYYENLNYDYAYLYQRTYSGVNFNQVIKKTKIYDFTFYSGFINVVYFLLLIIFTLFFILVIYQLRNCFEFNINSIMFYLGII